MEATRPDWRVSLKAGDIVSINATYDVEQGVVVRVDGDPARSRSRSANDPLAKDPFDDAAAVQAMYERGRHPHPRPPAGEHRREGGQEARSSPTRASCASKGRRVGRTGSTIDDFLFSRRRLLGAPWRSPTYMMRPPVVPPGASVTFTNLDAPFGAPDAEQVWHSITSCKAPCNRGAGIGYPLAARADQVRLGPARLRHRS